MAPPQDVDHRCFAGDLGIGPLVRALIDEAGWRAFGCGQELHPLWPNRQKHLFFLAIGIEELPDQSVVLRPNGHEGNSLPPRTDHAGLIPLMGLIVILLFQEDLSGFLAQELFGVFRQLVLHDAPPDGAGHLASFIDSHLEAPPPGGAALAVYYVQEQDRPVALNILVDEGPYFHVARVCCFRPFVKNGQRI